MFGDEINATDNWKNTLPRVNHGGGSIMELITLVKLEEIMSFSQISVGKSSSVFNDKPKVEEEIHLLAY